MQTIKCTTSICSAPADTLVFWPGKSPPPAMCASCTQLAKRVADVMGFSVHTQPLTQPKTEDVTAKRPCNVLAEGAD